MSTNWRETYLNKICTADEAVRKGIKEGDHLVFGHAAAAPAVVSKALYDNRACFKDLSVFHMLYFGEAWHLKPEMEGIVKPVLNFLEGNSRPAYNERRADFLPCHFHEVPDLFKQKFYPVDVAVVKLSEPDENGYCSFGISNDYTKPACECARTIIAEINPNMPYIGGDNFIHISQIDYIIEDNSPITEIPGPPIGEIEMEIGRRCSELIHDGDTLQLGIGAIPDAVLQCLKDRKDMGIHTEMFTDGVMHMIRSGNINGANKTLHPGKVVTTLIMGSRELYEFLDHNPMIEAYSVNYTNDPFIIGKNKKMISINSCIEVDLTGQVASESIGHNQFSGTGGQVDYLRGARRSEGGFSILAFPSTARNGKESRIVPLLKEGATVTSMRNDVDYFVTEYGVARLKGKTLKQRAYALVEIAHPQFRETLLKNIKERFE